MALYDEVKILKAGQSGFGYLIEHDAGYISPDEPRNKALIREFKKLDFNERDTDSLVVYVVLQKYGVKNRNGRIYPKEILVRQNEIYQEAIRHRRALGELDHPECHRDTAEILTGDGWKLLKDINEDESVYTLNPNSNEIELKKINRKIEREYNGKLISIKGRNIDLAVTPNHRFWVIKRNGIGMFITADDILNDNINGLDKMYIPKLGNWDGVDEENFIIKGETNFKKHVTQVFKETYSKDLIIDSITFHQFLGLWLAEGSVKGSKGSDGYGYKITITQKKEQNFELIRDILKRTGLKWVESNTNGKIDFICNDIRLFNFLKPLGNSKNKFIPTIIKNNSPKYLNELLETFIIGDGRTRGNTTEIFSTSKKLINDLHEILIKCGGSGNIREENRQFDRHINGRLIKGKNSSNMYFLTLSTTNGIWLDKRMLKVEEIDYSGMVYCVDVDNHIFYVRDNGKACWNGNSSVISGDRISHNIIETWWEGHTLMGKMEIPMTKGFINYGIVSTKGDLVAHYLQQNYMIGVSSRGVGSLKEVKGDFIVQDDFELICWDIVTAPSTPGSWMFKDKAEARPYVESVSVKKNTLNESLDRFLLG